MFMAIIALHAFVMLVVTWLGLAPGPLFPYVELVIVTAGWWCEAALLRPRRQDTLTKLEALHTRLGAAAAKQLQVEQSRGTPDLEHLAAVEARVAQQVPWQLDTSYNPAGTPGHPIMYRPPVAVRTDGVEDPE